MDAENSVVQVPYASETVLALNPHDAAILRRRLTRAINAGGPVLLAINSSGAGPEYRILTVNEDALHNADARKAVGRVVRAGEYLRLDEAKEERDRLVVPA